MIPIVESLREMIIQNLRALAVIIDTKIEMKNVSVFARNKINAAKSIFNQKDRI